MEERVIRTSRGIPKEVLPKTGHLRKGVKSSETHQAGEHLLKEAKLVYEPSSCNLKMFKLSEGERAHMWDKSKHK